MPRFSIVIPAHNVEPYLGACLESLIGQSFSDWEAVCVDDASTDGTGALAARYASRDPRIRLVVNERNMHLFATRHIGTAETIGEYVLYLDGDDEFTLDALKKLDEQLRVRPVDILQFQMEIRPDEESGVEYNEKAWYARADKLPAAYYEGDDLLERLCYERPDDLCTSHRVFCGDLVRDVFSRLGCEPGLRVAEDIVEQMALLLEAKSYEAIVDARYYIYNLGRGMSKGDRRFSLEEFTSAADILLRCQNNIMDYVDRNDLHSTSVDTVISWRWRLSVMLQLYRWRVSMDSADKPRALAVLCDRWPLSWTLPLVYQFMAESAAVLTNPETDEEAKAAWIDFRDCALSISALLPKASTEAPILEAACYHGFTPPSRFDVCDSKDCATQQEIIAFMLKSHHDIGMLQRDEYWRSDDESTRLHAELRQARQNEKNCRESYDEFVNSRSYKLTQAIAKLKRTFAKKN